MKNLRVACIGIFVVGIAGPGLFSGSIANESEAPESVSPDVVTELQLETLLTAQLEGVENTDVIISRVTIPPNSALPKHWHPGEEFVYVLSGSTILQMEGEADVTFGPGEVSKIPLKRVHSAATGDEGATILVFRVHERGAPERVLIE